MNLNIRVVLILTASLMATHALSQDLSGWSDKTVCRVAKATPDNMDYQAELTKRGLSCGGAITSSSSVANSKSNQAYESFPVHEFAKSPLRDLKVPENWQLFKDPKELDLFHDKFKHAVEITQLDRGHLWKMGAYFDDCERAISEWDQSWVSHKAQGLSDGIHSSFIQCATIFTYQHFQNRDEGIKVFERILLSWAKNKPVLYPDPQDFTNWNSDSGWGGLQYASTMLVGDFASFYAVYYDDFDFSLKQRQDIESYLSDWLINHDIDPPRGHHGCDLEDLTKFESNDDFVVIDYCGSNRWRMGLGAVYLGLRTGNQELFTAGNRHIEINLSVIDKDGIYAPWAKKGAMALSYSRQLPEVLTLLAVAYESIGYDFYEHKLPHGKKIHEVYESLFDFIYYPEKLDKYASTIFEYGTNLRFDNYDTYSEASLSEKWRHEMIYPEVLAAQSKGYVLRYRPDLLDKINYHKTWNKYWHAHISVFVNISGIAIYESFNQNVSKLIQKQKEELEKKQKENRLRLKKVAEKIKLKKVQEQLKQKAKQIEEVSKLAIFNFKDGSFSLILDQVDFIESELPQKQNMNNGFELHKASINGELKLSSNAQVGFRTLVYQKLMFQENRLSINVSEMTDPEMNPFKRHRKPLQKKCGVGLMDEWDWLSFITKTSDIKTAKNQQCHYDYFKETNDKEAWELFQAVLGGTDSILGYLQTNVKR